MDLYHLAGGIGIVLTLTGLWRLVANLRFLTRTTAVEGKFDRWEITAPGKVGGPSSENGRRSYRPVIAFRAADGSMHKVTGAIYRQAFHAPDTPKGTSLPVRYDATNPADARVVTFVDFWMYPLGMLGAGIFSLVTAVNS